MRRVSSGDLSGAVADLGVLVPLVGALVLVSGLDPGPVLLGVGLLLLASGLGFGIPFPVQPLKALTALAVAQQLDPDVIHSAGLQIGLVLVGLALTGTADLLARVFTRPVIRSLQLGVGALLVGSAVNLVRRPPALFESAPDPGVGLLLMAGTLALVALAAWRQRPALTLGLLVAGTAATWAAQPPDLGTVQASLPSLSLPPWSVAGSAFVLLVIPQLPLTYGNAVVGVSDLAREHFGPAARRVTPGRVALSCGLGNVAAAALGGMPMCHGSSGFSAHVRLGARTPAMNVVLGSAFVLLGVVFPEQVLAVLGVLPVWALAGFLAYAGLRHALLVLDQRGRRLVLAVVAAALGLATGNLAVTTGVALAVEHIGALTARRPARATG
ncbi:MAG: putative sulfate/molybdate transporter [Acidimicrobiia bacterium]